MQSCTRSSYVSSIPFLWEVTPDEQARWGRHVGANKLTRRDGSVWATPTKVRACLHEGGGPQVGEVTWGGLPHLACKGNYIKMRDYMDRRVTPPKRVTSPIWGTPPPCK